MSILQESVPEASVKGALIMESHSIGVLLAAGP